MTTALSMSFEPKDLDEAIRFSEKLATSKLVPKALQGAASDVLIVLLSGRELGIAPMASLRMLSVIEGKVVIGSEAYLAVVRAKPDCEYFRCEETTAVQATFVAKRAGHPEQRLTWTLKMAGTARLLTKDNWVKYPEAMLRWRCVGALARLEFAHHFAGVYTPDEEDELRTEKDVTPARSESTESATAPPARGVAALAATIAQVNTIDAAQPETVGSTISVVRPPPLDMSIDAGAAAATAFRDTTPSDPVAAAAVALAALAPKASPPKARPARDRQSGNFKDKKIVELTAAELAGALEDVGAFLKSGKGSKKALDVSQVLLGELMGEQDHRINAAPAEPPEPGSDG